MVKDRFEPVDADGLIEKAESLSGEREESSKISVGDGTLGKIKQEIPARRWASRLARVLPKKKRSR